MMSILALTFIAGLVVMGWFAGRLLVLVAEWLLNRAERDEKEDG